ncbi:aromatic prenyltransferase [Aspergillus affinis]|uniref:aromatic prenyltransferase n=1 Tax=Aspergillus affinis TaxID=1070780 RepID=UPI0022FE3AA4|nr:aromatic prenyltransferase [Aspergillus affinis]KAI9037497.1 aromatic prenyltransferase [Aspergillus affinis]
MQAKTLPSENGLHNAKESQSVEYWTQYVRSIMAPLFQAAGSYSPIDQESHLKFMDEFVAPNLGPLPTEPHAPYTPPASLVGSPFDPSINMASSGKAKIRCDFDIVRPAQRAGPDPFAEHASRETALHIASKTGSDTKWMEGLMAALLLSPEETEFAVANVPPNIAVPPLSIGFDFDGSQRTMKCYIPSLRKSIATGRPAKDLFFEALRRLEPMGARLAPGLDILEDYLATTPSDVQFMLLGFDCLDPVTHPEARVKCYLHTLSNAFAVVRDVMTLGGRLDDETARARVETLKSIWSILRNEPDDAPMDESWCKPDRVDSTGYSGLLFTVEITPGEILPDTKVYIPVFQYAETNKAVELNVELMLQKLGNDWGLTGRYRETLRNLFGAEEYGQTYASFTYNKAKGVCTTSYFAKSIDQVDRRLAGDFGIRLH